MEIFKEKLKKNWENLNLLKTNLTLPYCEKIYENIIIDFLNLLLNFIKNIILLIILFLNKTISLIDYINENDVLKNIKSNIILNNDKK